MLVVIAAALIAAAAPRSCDVDDPLACSLNGACAASACNCDVGWKGVACGELDLNPDAILAYGYPTNATSSWGGGPPVFDGTRWHLFVSELAGHCGMGTWSRMSQAVHAVSHKREGPYTRAGLAIPTQTHNTYYAYSPQDKLHLIYSIFGGTSPQSCNAYKSCTNGTTPGHGGGVHPDSWLPAPKCPLEPGTHVHYSTSLDGPWISAGALKTDRTGCPACGSSNPAPYIFPNGTVLMLARAKDSADGRHNIYLYSKRHRAVPTGTERCRLLYRAPSWNSTYKWIDGGGVNGTRPRVALDANGDLAVLFVGQLVLRRDAP
eukprot:gene18969-2549_t